MVELLAPAGDKKSLYAAVMGGASAVYLGLGNFNARMKAENFSEEDLKETVEFAHFYGVKVYVAINTILQNCELAQLLECVRAAVKAGADAFLVQDIGVCRLLRERFEGIELHASTQMGIHNLEGAKVAERMGVKRVVLSRETTLEDIKAIKAGTSLELEYFVQGALCVAFSGECYMSSVEQGASGNRGLCKQMCRLPYEARLGEFKKTGYLLSARDLCLAESVGELRKAGVEAFKIEGRMRREGYVAKAVSVYRKFVFGAEDKLSAEDKFALKTAFSRGEYLLRPYLDGGTPSVVEPRFCNHTGVEIGKVVEVRPFKRDLFEVTAALNMPIADGDGLKLFDGDVEKASLGVGGVRREGKNTYKFVTSTRVKEGWSVRLTLDSAAERALLENKRYREMKMFVTAMAGGPLIMRAECIVTDRHGERVTVEAEACSETLLEVAKNAPMSEDMLREQATKTTYAGFVTTSCDVRTDGVFAPKSAVNCVRRELLQKLTERVIAAFGKNDVKESCEPLELPKFEELPHAKADIALHTVMSEDLLKGVFLKKGEMAALAPSEYTAQEVKNMLEALDLAPDEAALKLPPLACGKDIQKIEALLSAVPNLKTLVANNLYGLSFAKRGYMVIAGEGMNIANDFAAAEAVRLGACGVASSIEFENAISVAAQEEPNTQGSKKIKLFLSDKRYPLMTLAHCPFKTLFENDCAHCSYAPGLTLSRERHKYAVRRVRLSRCIFELYPV